MKKSEFLKLLMKIYPDDFLDNDFLEILAELEKEEMKINIHL